MPAVDPTYPLYPVANIMSGIMLLLVLMTSFARHNWNLGVAFLCFWLFLENLTFGINAIVWSNNADIRLYVYCDIGEWHLTPGLCMCSKLDDSVAFADHR